ncbi:hypothetical protein [Phragmitibacter flavus]|nr:hypothetical protein [Phragmitibacter flavus]
MFRSWTWWITLLLLVVSLGYFWMLGRGVVFLRVDPNTKPTPEAPR